MSVLWMISTVLLWAIVLLLGFLLLGTLRSIEWLRWRMEQLEATTPSHVGRSGLRPGINAPDFTLPNTSGEEVSLHDYVGRKLLLVFTQTGCGPCRAIVPELNRLDRNEIQVLVINRGGIEKTRRWAAEAKARFPVLAVEGLELARRYEVFATPFAFLIDGRGVVVSKGIVGDPRYITFFLSGPHAEEEAEETPAEHAPWQGRKRGSSFLFSHSLIEGGASCSKRSVSRRKRWLPSSACRGVASWEAQPKEPQSSEPRWQVLLLPPLPPRQSTDSRVCIFAGMAAWRRRRFPTPHCVRRK